MTSFPGAFPHFVGLPWGEDPGGGRSLPLQPTKVALLTIGLYNSEEHSRCKAFLSSIVLSQQCCKLYFIPLSSEAFVILDHQIILKSTLLTIDLTLWTWASELWGRGVIVPPRIWNFLINILAKKGRFLSFEWAKWNFATFGPPLEKYFWLRLEKSTFAPLWWKSFRRPCHPLTNTFRDTAISSTLWQSRFFPCWKWWSQPSSSKLTFVRHWFKWHSWLLLLKIPWYCQGTKQ